MSSPRTWTCVSLLLGLNVLCDFINSYHIDTIQHSRVPHWAGLQTSGWSPPQMYIHGRAPIAIPILAYPLPTTSPDRLLNSNCFDHRFPDLRLLCCIFDDTTLHFGVVELGLWYPPISIDIGESSRAGTIHAGHHSGISTSLLFQLTSNARFGPTGGNGGSACSEYPLFRLVTCGFIAHYPSMCIDPSEVSRRAVPLPAYKL